MRMLRRVSPLVLALLLAVPTVQGARGATPGPDDPQVAAERIEVSEVPHELRAGAGTVEFTATLRNTGGSPLLLEPYVTVFGDFIRPEHILLELLDPTTNRWGTLVLDPARDLRVMLPYRGAEKLSGTSGRLAPNSTLAYRLRFTLAASAPPQLAGIEIGGEAGPSAPGEDKRFGTFSDIEFVVVGADGTRPALPPPPDASDASDPPSAPDAGPADFGGTAMRVAGVAARNGGPAFDLTGVPGWIRAGAGAFEFHIAISNDTGRTIDALRPQLLFTSGGSGLAAEHLKVEAFTPLGHWTPVPLSHLIDVETGRPGHLLGALDSPVWETERHLPAGEFTTIKVRVWFPAESPATGHDVAVLAGTDFLNPAGGLPLSRSDFRVFRVTAAGAPDGPPRLRPVAPGEAPTKSGAADTDDGDPFTFATIAIWLALGGVVVAVVYFARRNRGRAPEDPDPYGPDA
ncbi:hypothetical protein [Embleya sp. NBC_00896]|uniref:hypothetical protein n=1 Tax=Embleya sp. NBC_00896 TaxID=2975961 RepID=UPI003868EAF0|nr:hypothetical protein OG928_24225 [Embleya sp. NBC_00896]